MEYTVHARFVCWPNEPRNYATYFMLHANLDHEVSFSERIDFRICICNAYMYPLFCLTLLVRPLNGAVYINVFSVLVSRGDLFRLRFNLEKFYSLYSHHTAMQ